MQAGQPGRAGGAEESRALKSSVAWRAAQQGLTQAHPASKLEGTGRSELCRRKRQWFFPAHNLYLSFPGNLVGGKLLHRFKNEWRNAEKANP